MTDLYNKPGDITYKKERTLSVFPQDELEVLAPEDEKVDPIPVYDGLKGLIDRAGEITDDLEKVCEAFSIPIAEDEAQVRAAHMQLGGDGVSIKFQEYKAAVDEHQEARGDYLNEGFDGLGTGDMAKVKQTRYNRSVKKRGSRGENSDEDIAIFDELSKYGANAVLLYLLGEEVGVFTSTDLQAATAGKYPPGVEAGAIISMVIQGLLMIQSLTGMTEDAIDEYQNIGDALPKGIDIKDTFEQFKKAGPPKSEAYGFYRDQMASQNHELLMNYSVGYCAKNVGDGYESWLGYLGARTTHEDALRSYYDGAEYRSGDLELGEAHSELLNNKTAGGQAMLDMVALGLGRKMDWGETCCLLRFLDMFTPNVLEIMRSIIQMSIANLEWQCQQSFQWFLDVANHPWNVISEKLVKELDKLFEKIIEELLSAMEIDNATMEVLKACTPIGELMDFVLSAVVEIQSWYHNMIRNIGISFDKTFRNMTIGWQTTFKIRRAKELLLSIDELLEKAEIIGELREDDNLIAGIVGKLTGSTWSYDVPGSDGVSDVAGFTGNALDWCRKIGDWDYIRTQVGSLTGNTEAAS